MIYLLLLIVLECSSVLCLAQGGSSIDDPYRKHTEGAVRWTLGATTRLYTAPATTVTYQTILPVGTAVTILECLDETEQRQGVYNHWYRVRYKELEGFVWGGELAIAQFNDTTSLFKAVYGLQKITSVQRGVYQEPQLEIAVVAEHQGQWLDSIHIVGVGTLYTRTQAQSKGRQGLAGVEQVVEIAFSDGYCGGVAAVHTLLWDGQKWHSLGTLSQGFGDNSFSNSYYNYPQEHQRGSHIIELHRVEGYYNSSKQPIFTSQKMELYEWTGTQLLRIE